MQSKEESKCRCYRNFSNFQEIINLKNTGLAIYRYSSQVKGIEVKSSFFDKIHIDDVYIFHNTTNLDINTDKYLEFGQYIKCARCKYLFDHASKLFKKISHINKFGIISLCDYCQAKEKHIIPCKHCYETVKKFIASKNKSMKEKGELIQCVNNVKYSAERCKLQSSSHSELHSNNYFAKHNFAMRHRLMDAKLRTDQLYDFRGYSSAEMSSQQKNKYLLKTTENEDIFNSNLKTKIVCNENKFKFLFKYVHVSEGNINVNMQDFDMINVLQRKYSCDTVCNYLDNKLSDEYSGYKPIKCGYSEMFTTPHSDTVGENLMLQSTEPESVDLNSKKSFLNFDDTVVQGSLQKSFSFFFIKTSNKQPEPPRICKSSSGLIRDTQEMIRAKAEKNKKTELQESNKVKNSEITNKTDQFKLKTLTEETKEKTSQDNEKKSYVTEKLTVGKLSNKKLKKKVIRLSLNLSKKENNIKIKSEAKEKDNNKKMLKTENELIKVAQEQEKIQKAKKDKLFKKDEMQRQSVKKEKQRRNIKEELSNGEPTKKDDLKESTKTFTEQKKQKDEVKKLKKNEQEENIQNKKVADKLTKLIQFDSKETKPIAKTELKPKSEDRNTNESKVNKVTIRNVSTDDLILQLVKLKQSYSQKVRVQPKRLSELNIDPLIITAHKNHQNKKQSNCIICNDSELELDIENIVNSKYGSKGVEDIIIGQKILKYNPHSKEKVKKTSKSPILYTSDLQDDVNIPKYDLFTNVAEENMEGKAFSAKNGDLEIPKGVIRYALSDRTFIDKGWTMLPTEKVVRKMNVYRMRPSHPEFDWFEHNKNKKLINYDTGEKLAEFDDNGRGRWFYRNGKLALDYYDAKEINAKQRFVIYSNGEPDERGRSRPLVILATFDYLGNGVVFDHAGKIRLKYNQTEGVLLDRSIGPVSHWKWHTLNDPPVLQQVMIDTQMAHKDPDIFKLGGPADEKVRSDNEEMLAIEFDNFIKEKSKKLSQKFKPFQIKMKALKINEHFSLKVLDQPTVYLIFRDGSTNLKINIGMILDHQEIVDTDTAEVGEVSNSLERFPAQTDSLAGLQKSVAYAQRVERARLERERRFRPTEPSADKINAVVSRPLRTLLQKVSTRDTVTSTEYKCRCRKSSCHLYYDTRLN